MVLPIRNFDVPRSHGTLRTLPLLRLRSGGMTIEEALRLFDGR
jgi:hypothetical protein